MLLQDLKAAVKVLGDGQVFTLPWYKGALHLSASISVICNPPSHPILVPLQRVDGLLSS